MVGISFNVAMVLLSTEAPAEFLKPLTDLTVKELETAMFECEVSKPKLKAKWFRDGQELKDDKRFEMTSLGQKHLLTIRQAQVSDQCKYTVVVEEGVESSANLTVEGRSHTHIHARVRARARFHPLKLIKQVFCRFMLTIQGYPSDTCSVFWLLS